MQHLLKSTFTFILLCLVLSVSAQAPPKFNYQGIARDANGNPIANQRMSIQLEILASLEATHAEYQETQTITTNEFGLYTLQIGNGIPTVGDMKLVKWETGNQYIHVRIDPSGGNQFVEAGTTQLLSVPYALYADKAGVARESLNGNTQKNTRATNNYIEKTSGAGVANSTSLLYDNGTSIGLGTTTPSARFQISQNIASVQEHLRMQNSSATGAGRFTLYNDGASSYATFTKYGSTYAGGYAGITTLYPYANLLAFGNNGLASGDGLGRFLISSAGNIGISIAKPGTSKLKLHLDYTSENVGIGGNSVPVSRVHLNNTDGTTMDVNLTNNTTGHTATDGLQIKNVGTAASITNKENDALTLGTNNTTRLTLTAAGNTELTGQIKIAGGAPGLGKVLTSDATGLASWQTPAAGGSSFFQVSPTNSNHIIYTNAANYGKNFLVNADSVNYDGAGIDGKMMFIGSKSAYRAGAVNTTAWNLDSIGLYSIGLGANTIAKGDHSVALGTNTIASGSFSTAIGNSTTASGLFSTAMGANTIAAGYGSFALGGFTIASGTYSTSIGQWSKANSVFETAIGNYNDTLVVANSTSWAGDSNRVFTVGNGTAANNRSTAFVVQQNGNVGIGVRVAQTKLDINGQIKISGGAPGLGKVLTSDANGLATWQTPSGGGSLPAGSLDQTLRHNGTTWVANSALTNNGTEVGIGVAASNAAPLTFASAVGKKINFYPAQPDGYCMGVEASDLRFAGGTAGSDAITFRTQGYNGTERMRIAGNGNVGIGGVTNPTVPLSFNDDLAAKILLKNSDPLGFRFGTWDLYQGSGITDLKIQGGVGIYDGIQFNIGNGGWSTYSWLIRFTNDENRFVKKTYFGNDSYQSAALQADNGLTGNQSWTAVFKNSANPSADWAHGIDVIAGANNYNATYQSTLIGFHKPNLGVLGDISQDGSNSVGYFTTSDIRLKQQIRPSHSRLDDLMKIEVKDYNYKSDKNNLPQNGFIAQQLYSVYPYAVKKGGEDEKTNPWMVDYGRVTPLIIQSVQDQQHIIDDLKSKLEAQQQLIEKLAKKVDELSSK